jgi:predicted DCC family thiol-disulfide oxidoreductase YuxK
MCGIERQDTGDIWVVYDGECPFCRSFVLLYRIRKLATHVHLVDARSHHPIVDEIRQQHLDLNQGMAVKLNGRLYHGSDAMNVLAILGSGKTVFNRLNRVLFRRPGVARLLYPLLARGRLVTLRLLGRPLIDDA